MPANADAECRGQYLKIHRRTWRTGIDAFRIAQNAGYSVMHGTTAEITVDAYRPTGVALGHPLPCARTTRRLLRFAKLFERKLAQTTGCEGPSFSFVPPSAYHVTVYNRSHFDRGRVFDVSSDEHRRAEAIIAAANTGALVIDLNGFLLSPDGRLLARGYPRDERLYALRRRLAEALPADAGRPPVLAHVKLGHFLVCPTLQQTRDLSDWLGRCSHHLNQRVVFGDAFTPLGRIPLGDGERTVPSS